MQHELKKAARQAGCNGMGGAEGVLRDVGSETGSTSATRRVLAGREGVDR